MELISLHERIYGKYKSKLYTFEPTWDSFRPILGVGWNGEQFIPIECYKTDLFCDWYGYESLEQKKMCQLLIQQTELADAKEIKDPVYVWRWYKEQNLVWWKDRPCVFSSPCISKDANSWKKYLKYLEVRAKTLRKPLFRTTRRLISK